MNGPDESRRDNMAGASASPTLPLFNTWLSTQSSSAFSTWDWMFWFFMECHCPSVTWHILRSKFVVHVVNNKFSPLHLFRFLHYYYYYYYYYWYSSSKILKPNKFLHWQWIPLSVIPIFGMVYRFQLFTNIGTLLDINKVWPLIDASFRTEYEFVS